MLNLQGSNWIDGMEYNEWSGTEQKLHSIVWVVYDGTEQIFHCLADDVMH